MDRITYKYYNYLEINNIDEKVYVLATTNMPWELDIAALRRFERKVLLPMPDLDARYFIVFQC
jgi:SpoVK/Ycf46/Vps4 family AAA+-type ATPase